MKMPRVPGIRQFRPPTPRCSVPIVAIGALGLATLLLNGQTAKPESPASAAAPSAAVPAHEFFSKYCFTCHNQKLRTAGLALDTLAAAPPSANAEAWEH